MHQIPPFLLVSVCYIPTYLTLLQERKRTDFVIVSILPFCIPVMNKHSDCCKICLEITRVAYSLHIKMPIWGHSQTYHILKEADTPGVRWSLRRFDMLPQAAWCSCKSFRHHWRNILLLTAFQSCKTLVLNCLNKSIKECITVLTCNTTHSNL